MAALTSEQIEEVRHKMFKKWGLHWDYTTDCVKSDWRTAVEEIDQWIEDNKASALGSISDPVKSELSNKQFLELFLYIVTKKWEIT